MKKAILSLMLAFLFCTLLSTGAAGATRGKISLSGSMAGLKQEATVKLTVELNRNPGVKTLRCTVGFDPNVLEFVKVEETELLPNFSYEAREDGVLLRWSGEKDMTSTGELAHLTLSVKKDAIYGDSAVTLNVSEKMYDAQNASGDTVPFDTADLKFMLLCPHKESLVSIEQEASFEVEGVLKKTCKKCEDVSLIPLLPSVSSSDGRVGADVAVGEFSASDVVEIRVEDLYGTEEAKAAREILGENVFFIFRIRFTKNGEDYSPVRDCSVRLSSDFPLPEGVTLYSMIGSGTAQPKFEQEGNSLHFAYDDTVFALVKRPYEEPVIPTVTTTVTTTPAPTTTIDLFEKERQRDLYLILAGGAALVLCGAGAVFLLGKRKKY